MTSTGSRMVTKCVYCGVQGNKDVNMYSINISYKLIRDLCHLQRECEKHYNNPYALKPITFLLYTTIVCIVTMADITSQRQKAGKVIVYKMN